MTKTQLETVSAQPGLYVNFEILAEYVAKYASKEVVDEAGEDTESEDEMSSVGSYESGGEEEPAGEMDDV